ncbi:hypothetical protein CGGC5_v010324 [Colletotrichum fructicola Nara gc5]|uniref:Uncharacterized protein n=1 Tax=Colletotrichum fructicola (strain Nara gc5) TaxID=1213859 RepID=A0A7J6IYI9_COLFN|nr:hypothetical protein CGGC5_v010324 [Colletotrichum fructicola Nara gc5]KAF4880223.1 hypothetical protein CGCFRS4_v016076 [Colletotrichum fructicola]
MRRYFLFAMLGLLSATAAFPKPDPTSLRFNDVVAVNEDGSHRILKTAEYDALLARVALEPTQPAPSVMDPSIVTNGDGLARRACRKSTEVQVMSDDQFFNWDVAISPILSSHRGTTRVSTSKGYSVGNSVSVSLTTDVSFAKIASGMSMSVNYA